MSWEPAGAERVRQAARRTRHSVLVLTVACAPPTRAIPYPRSAARWHPVPALGVTTSTAYRQWGYPKHRCPRRERFALFDRCVARQLQMRAAAWGDFGITADDRWAVLDRDLFEPDGFLTATTQDRDATSGANVLDPVCAVTQHGHQVLDTAPICDDYWEGNRLTASPADDLQAGSSSWHETSPEGKTRKTVLWFRQPVRPTGAVHPPRVPLKQLADHIHEYSVKSQAGQRKGRWSRDLLSALHSAVPHPGGTGIGPRSEAGSS